MVVVGKVKSMKTGKARALEGHEHENNESEGAWSCSKAR